MDEPTGKQNALMAFFSSPIVGIIGSIASIIGFAISIYFYIATQEAPELTYFVHPVKAAVVRAGQASNITVQLEGKNLVGDVTAAQIAIWNAGKKPIRAANILRPLVIRTSGKAKILEARLKKTTREVVGLTLDTSRLAAGEVEIKWDILEQNDGGVVQLIYCGDEKSRIEASAVVEGQPEIALLEERTLSDPSEEYMRQRLSNRTAALFLLGLSMSVLLCRLKKGKEGLNSDKLMLIYFSSMIALSSWILFCRTSLGPPFGF